MAYKRILVNKNEIISESTYNVAYSNLSGKYALHVVFSGEVDYIIERRNITLLPGSFIFLNHDTRYSKSIKSDVEVKTLIILFDPGFVHDFAAFKLGKEGLRLVESIQSMDGDFKFNLTQLGMYIESGMNDQLLLSEYLNRCLLGYQEIYQDEIVNREEALQFLNGATKTEILKRLSIARDFMISNYSKPICLEEIAKMACLSVNHLLRTYKQAYQQSPYQFLTKVRLLQAKHLLKNTNYPVNEIVDIVGFECPSSFIRLFRNSFNVTPGKYR